jgi:2-oxo-4-hydroxy-4-carboxy-5-ureidoimidazoline decarboxylase
MTQAPVQNTLERWNNLPDDAAADAILPCNGSQRWAQELANQRPFRTAEDLFAAADNVWNHLPETDWQQAFDSHPRIGETHAKAASEKSLAWSTGEQATANPDAATLTELAEGNRAYEQKFGRIFVVCASGKSATEMLTILERRLANDPETEVREAAEQQRQITQIRLRKWLELPPDYGKEL